jgi:hypothetical protein
MLGYVVFGHVVFGQVLFGHELLGQVSFGHMGSIGGMPMV